MEILMFILRVFLLVMISLSMFMIYEEYGNRVGWFIIGCVSTLYWLGGLILTFQ